MRKKILLTITACLTLLAGSGTAWGQHGVLLPENHGQQKITPRRVSHEDHRDTIGSAFNVGHTFGAGESVLVKAGRTVAWPASAKSMNSALLIGSDYSKNAVVGIYDNDGDVAGALLDVKLFNSGYGTDITSQAIMDGSPSPPTGAALTATGLPEVRVSIPEIKYDPSKDGGEVTGTGTADPTGGSPLFNNRADYYPQTAVYSDGVEGTGSYYGSAFYPYKNDDGDYVVVIHNHISGWPTEANQEKFIFSGATADTMYTTTRNEIGKKDDGVSLLYKLSGSYDNAEIDEDDFSATLNAATYVRPTTILLSEKNELSSITIGDIEWYASYWFGVLDYTESVAPFPAFVKNNCGHYSGWASYNRNIMKYDTLKNVASGRYVDAAVRLLDGADICVTGDVLDNTTSKYSINTNDDTKTDAILVLPGANDNKGERSNFRLKIGGDADMLHTQDSGYTIASNPLDYGYLYSDAASGTGPGAAFPTVPKPVFLSGGGATPLLFEDEVFGLNWSYDHPREVGTLTDKTGDETKWMPYASTTASVYGVNGLYLGGTDIHTRSVGGYDTTSIIQIGSITNNQDKFHIYSSGMLKNFRSDCVTTCDTLLIGDAQGKAPKFYLSNDSMPLYIIHDGNGSGTLCCTPNGSGIKFTGAGVTSLNNAFTAPATGGGDLHIQSQGFVKFYDQPLNFALTKDNEIKILSDSGYIYADKGLSYTNADTSHLTVWARGKADGSRGYTGLVCGSTGAVRIDGDVTATYAGPKGTGLVLFRSDYDDVLFKAFSFTNTAKQAESGELMIQAGQDIYAEGDVTVTQAGERSILLEAISSIHTRGNVTFDRTNAVAGDITMKAGYVTNNPDNRFSETADPGTHNNDWKPSSSLSSSCPPNDYDRRGPNTALVGGDIWFEGIEKDVKFTIPSTDPSTEINFNTTLRAYGSIFIDPTFTYDNTAKDNGSTHLLMFAEIGNIEAIQSKEGNNVTIKLDNDVNNTFIRIQAGNAVSMSDVSSTGDMCKESAICHENSEWNKNILFNKPLNIIHSALGETLISAERDIENQVKGPMTFTYKNPNLVNPFLMAAGRHIETHSKVLFDYTNASTTTDADITMHAGRFKQVSLCKDTLCKVPEYGSTLTENNGLDAYDPDRTTPPLHKDNDFSKGGTGNGSILLFDSLEFIYKGTGDILMTAVNGNIESDPYLHGNYGGDAAIQIDHNASSGKTTLEAIDIRLHDVFNYDATTPATTMDNGTLNFFAFDSILTRNLTYTNPTNNGNVSIIADKYKSLGLNGCFSSITQGHIVLGYGVDDVITFDFGKDANTSTDGANLYIKAGYEGFATHPDKKNEYGGNITYDHMIVNAALGVAANRTAAGYTEISTPNGNIWGKDILEYDGFEGNLLVDAGLGSEEDGDAIAWKTGDVYDAQTTGRGIDQNILNTSVPEVCESNYLWRTGNIMMKGASLDFDGKGGNAAFRTREGYIDTYDAFDVTNMKGELLKYAHANNATTAADNQFGDISERDFSYTPAGGSVYYGADDNIMFNYGNSNGKQYYDGSNTTCNVTGSYSFTDSRNKLYENANPYYSTSYKGNIGDVAVFNVNTNGYLFYKNMAPVRNYHFLYRGGNENCVSNSGLTGKCDTRPNGARDMMLDFSVPVPNAGGFAAVANNYIDFFTKFIYKGGNGSGMPNPTVGNLLYESVSGHGLYLKSRNEGAQPEARRVTCFNCNKDGEEWPALTFHDDARIYMEGQRVLLEAPVIEFFGHAELNATSNANNRSKFEVKADSLIFHDSAIFDGSLLQLLPFTMTDRGMRHGVVNDENYNTYKAAYGPAIVMDDRKLPVLELGYQRCNEPMNTPNASTNEKGTAHVGGDVIVAVKNGYELPILNTVVANHARISFIDDMIDGDGRVYLDANVRTDLLRIRNKVEFFTDPAASTFRKGTFKMTSDDQMPSQRDAGIYMRHLHLEPGSELSIPGEDSLTVIATTTVGGYGRIHENITVKANGIIAPGYASFMEYDCTSGSKQGKLTVHDLQMEKDAEFRVSIGSKSCIDPSTNDPYRCTQMDTLHVKGRVHFTEKIPVYVLTEDKTIEPGCYLFMIYDDLDGVSKERVKNLELEIDRYQDVYFNLNFTIPGEVWLCASYTPEPILLQYVDLPYVEGVTTNPSVGKHYVASQKHFTFTATYPDEPLKIMASGEYSHQNRELIGEKQKDGSFKYILTYVVEPWTVTIGPDLASDFVGNSGIGVEYPNVWAHNSTLYIHVPEADIVSIYSMAGVLQHRMEIPEGDTKLTLERGMYIVTLKDGSVHKIAIK